MKIKNKNKNIYYKNVIYNIVANLKNKKL